MRRFVLICLPALAVWVLLGTKAGAQNDFRGGYTAPLTVEADREELIRLEEAKQAIEAKHYLAAVRSLQSLIDRPEDSFLKRDFKLENATAGGLRKEAIRLLQSLPPEGIAAYDLSYGAEASQLLATAVETDDVATKAEVVRRFPVTAAGYQAALQLAAQAADASHPLEAALLIEPLRYHPKRQPQLALQRAVYWGRAGRLERGVAALRELKRTVPTGKMQIAGEEVKLPTSDEEATPWLKSYLAKTAAQVPPVEAWLLPGGNAARNASAQAASPVGGSLWRVSTLEHLTLDGRPEEDRRHRAAFREVIERIRQSLIEENRPLMTAAQPLVVGDKVIYRTIGDVTAVSLKTGDLLWRSSLLDESLARLINPLSMDARLRGARSLAIESHLEQRVDRDLTAGTISCDGETVFALEELERQASVTATTLGFVSEARAVNKLVAYDLTGGRMLWEVGGPRGSLPDELSSQFFLGPPLPLDGRLYVMSEVQGALRLSVLKQDPARRSVQVEWSQTLISVNQPLIFHMPRRLSGLSPSIADGVLVCPTSSGAVVAVDLTRRALLWGFQYDSSVTPVPQNGFGFQGRTSMDLQAEEADKTSRWMDNTVVIAEGKVLVTPRDSTRMFCLDLVDGHELWHLDRDDWMYVACAVDGKAILVGRHGVGAVHLADGTQVKSFVEAEVEPTGRGVRVGTSYFLPTSNGEIATIDLRSGQVVAQSKLAQGVVPGNLAAGGGAIVSLSSTDVTGFAPLSQIQRQIAEDLQADPQNPRALALRGEMRLHRGDEAEGLADLRESLQRQPDPHVKSVLAAALLSNVRAKPATIRDVAGELEAITEDPQQKNEYLRLYSQALEDAGDRRGAFAQMIRLAQTAQFLDDMQTVESGYSVRTGRSIRARLMNMYAIATPTERAELDRTLEQHIRSFDGIDRARHLERCLRFFSGLPKAESLLLDLTIQLEEGKRRDDLLKSFSRSGEPDIAGRATAIQCAALIATEQYIEAVPLIGRLRTDFANRECLNGKTGRSLAEQWGAAEPLRELLTAHTVWPTGRIDDPVRVDTPMGTDPIVPIPCDVISRSGPTLAGWSFETESRGSNLIARDATGAVRWELQLPADVMTDPEGRTPLPNRIWIYDGWLVLARTAQFIVIDGSVATPRMAWQQSLRTSMELQQQLVNPRRNARFGFATTQQQQGVGRVIGITRETVIYAMGSKLRACELETGRLAWSRQDISSNEIDGSADDAAVMVYAPGNITVLRTLDGSRLAKRILHLGDARWGRGSQLLVTRPKGTRTVIEMRNTITDTVIWSTEASNQSLPSVVDDEDLALLEPNGQLTMLRLVDGHERYRAELPLKFESRDKSWFTVQRCLDRDLILGGATYAQRTGLAVVPFVTPNSRPTMAFDGYVCSVATTDGKLQWATPVERAALDRSQAASLPVLLLATRHLDTRMNGNPFSQRFRLNACILDKRTGRRIYEIEEASSPLPPRLDADLDAKTIFANFHEWQLKLTFPEMPEVAR